MEASTITLRLLSDETLPILRQLERVHLLEILPVEAESRPNAASWAGVLSPEETAQWQRDLQTMRDEWDRDS